MAKFLALQSQSHSIIDECLQAQKNAEEVRDRETLSVSKIQSFIRGCKGRRVARTKLFAVYEIQRFYRGWADRVKCMKLAQERKAAKELAFYNAAAIAFQKIYRGYRSRKYVHNYYARKAYLSTVIAKNEQMRVELRQYQREQIEMQHREAQEKLELEKQKLAGKLHHLVSTKAARGVFHNAPEMEERLKEAQRSQPLGVTKERTLKVIARPLRETGTIRVGIPYDSKQELERFEMRVSKAKRVGDEFKFKKVRSTEELTCQAASQSVHINTPFIAAKPPQREEDKSRHISISKPFRVTVKVKEDLLGY